ncbi:MAG: guanylate kinase [Desulfobacteraceae bacterium]|nr:guanylate kinase [Desulfobacteraceae bacterium]
MDSSNDFKRRTHNKVPPADIGNLFVISAPSGAGKTTICKALRQKFPELTYSVSSTTRPPRKGEIDGVDYFFLSRSEFEAQIQAGGWAEWAKVHGHYYGTSAVFLDAQLARGNHILLDIDVQGAAQLLNRYPDAVSIFIMPPSINALRCRLEKRDTDQKEVIDERITNAKMEIAKRGMYQHVVVNDDLETAKQEISGIVATHLV